MTVGGNLTDPYALVPRCGVVVEHQLLSVFMDLFRDVGTADKTRTKCLFFYWKLSFTHVWQWFILINFFFLIHIIYTWIYHPSLQVWLLPLFSLILKKKKTFSDSVWPNSLCCWRAVSHCRQKTSRCILITQQRGLRLIDITVILFWSTFSPSLFIFASLHCSLCACVCARSLWIFLPPVQQREWEKEKDTGGTYTSAGEKKLSSTPTVTGLL